MPHTPGPWTMRKDGIILTSARQSRKAIGQFIGMASEQQHVNEHGGNCTLIAAAPDLLAALKSILATIERSEQWWMDCPEKGGFDAEQIAALIARAEEPNA